MFEREHHRRIARVLQALDGPALSACGCLFGGGTAIVLQQGEYRESADIDFIVSDLDGYRELRAALTSAIGLERITRPGHSLRAAREIRADQYGIRTLLDVDGARIKFEIVLEARIKLAPPQMEDQVLGVPCLTRLDMASTKLLANSDRWADSSVLSRDLIDLAMLQPRKPLLTAALAKAQTAYGEAAARDLLRAIQALREQPKRLAQCMQGLAMLAIPRALLWQRIVALQSALPDVGEPKGSKGPTP